MYYLRWSRVEFSIYPACNSNVAVCGSACHAWRCFQILVPSNAVSFRDHIPGSLYGVSTSLNARRKDIVYSDAKIHIYWFFKKIDWPPVSSYHTLTSGVFHSLIKYLLGGRELIIWYTCPSAVSDYMEYYFVIRTSEVILGPGSGLQWWVSLGNQINLWQIATLFLTRVEAGSNTSTVNLRIVRGDEMGLKKAVP
jgi:hypothetical protein